MSFPDSLQTSRNVLGSLEREGVQVVAVTRLQLPVALIGVLLASLLLLLVAFSSARTAEATHKSGNTFQFGCNFVKTDRIDPFKDELGITHVHRHEVFGYRGLQNNSTVTDLLNGANSCGPSFIKAAYWNPLNTDAGTRNMPKRLSVYYSGWGDVNKLVHIPQGAKLYGTDEDFRCGTGQARQTPPYAVRPMNSVFAYTSRSAGRAMAYILVSSRSPTAAVALAAINLSRVFA